MKNLIKKIGQNKFQFFFFVGIVALLAIALIVSTVMSNNDKTPDPDTPNVVNPEPSQDDPAVTKPEEVLKLPFQETMSYKVVRKFYSKDASRDEQVQALIKYGNSYRTSSGTVFAANDDSNFEVLSSLSGKVAEIKESPLYGNYVVLEHENNIKTYYYGLSDVTVTVGATIAQGDKIGTSGFMTIDKEAGNHVFVEVSKDGTRLNIETLIGKKISEIQK